MKCKFSEKSLFFALLLMMLSSQLHAQEWIQNIKNPNMPFLLQISSQTLGYSEAENYSDEVKIDRISAKAVVPFSQSENFKQSFSLDFNQFKIDQLNKAGNSPIPDKLSEEKIGYQFSSKKDEDKYYGLNLLIGSSSDKPFHDWSVTEVNLTPYYYFDKNPNESWVLLLNYSNQRSFLPNIPLPGFIYIYNTHRRLSLYAGIPVFGAIYKATDNILLNYISVLPWMHQFKMTYLRFAPFQIYSEYKVASEVFKSVNYVENEDRIILQDQKVTIGLKTPLTKEMSLDVYSGVSFDRKIYQSERPHSSKDWNEKIENQKFFNIQLGVKF